MKVAIMGYGTIGSGVAEVLKVNRDLIKRKTGKTLEVKYILDLREFPGDENEGKIIHDFSVIDQDDEVELVVETMGGVNPAYTFVKTCLESGKHVVTSNKALVAAHGTELLSIAREKEINFLFEASVGGGIPLKVDGRIIGGLGISGGTGEEDHSLAEYGLSVLPEIL